MVSLLRHLHGPSKFLGKLVFSNLVMSHFQRYFGGSRYFPVLSRCDVKFWDKFVAPQTATRKQARSQLSPPTRQALLGVRDLGSLPLVAGGTAAATCLEREDHGDWARLGHRSAWATEGRDNALNGPWTRAPVVPSVIRVSKVQRSILVAL